MERVDSSRISPTAHYTGFVWGRHGLSHPGLRTRRGWLLYHTLQPFMLVTRAIGGVSIEDVLLARHRMIDRLLAEWIDSQQIGQVIEIAAGLSLRGHRFMQRFGDRGLVYVEGDLAAMCAQKRALLRTVGPRCANHHVVELDALVSTGANALEVVSTRLLDPAVGTAIITEGLLSYFDGSLVAPMWRRIAQVLAGFPRGRYIAETYMACDVNQVPGTRAFHAVLGVFARGRVHVHFADDQAAEAALVQAGFARNTVHKPRAMAAALDLSAACARAPVRVLCAEV